MVKKIVLGIALAVTLVMGGAGVSEASYTMYDWYYDGYHAEAPNNFTKEEVAWGVEVGDITAEQYEQIVGEPYAQ